MASGMQPRSSWSALNSLLRAAKGFLMGQPHDGPTCCLIIARVRFRNPHSHLGTIFPGGPCPPIDMLCKAAQLAAMHATTFIVRRPLLRIRIRALQVRVCMTPLSMPTSRGWLYLTFRFPAARSLHHRVEETTLERGRARVTGWGMMTWFEQGVAGVSGNHLKCSLLKTMSNFLKIRNNHSVKTLKVHLVSGKFVPSSVSYSLFVIRMTVQDLAKVSQNRLSRRVSAPAGCLLSEDASGACGPTHPTSELGRQ